MSDQQPTPVQINQAESIARIALALEKIQDYLQQITMHLAKTS